MHGCEVFSILGSAPRLYRDPIRARPRVRGERAAIGILWNPWMNPKVTEYSMIVRDQSPTWQPEKHLHSGDRIWILTDIERYGSRFHPWSEEQKMFRVGIYDLGTRCVGLAHFGRDIAFEILKAGVDAPPWNAPLAFGIELHRDAHEHNEGGRYRGRAILLDLPPEAVALGQAARKMLAGATFSPNAVPGMWKDLEVRATKERAIEAAVESMRGRGPFAAGDIRKIVGPEADVTASLQRLVEDGVLLPPTGRKRGTKYRHVPPLLVDRADWVG